MKLDISIRTSNPELISEIAGAKIADGITIQQSRTIKEMVNPPIDFIIYIGEHLAVPVIASLIARYLYDKLKERKDNQLTVGHNAVEINLGKIEQQITVILEKEKSGDEQTKGYF